MPSKRDVSKRRIRAEQLAAAGAGQGHRVRGMRRRRMVVGAVAVLVSLMMVASLAVGLFAAVG